MFYTKVKQKSGKVAAIPSGTRAEAALECAGRAAERTNHRVDIVSAEGKRFASVYPSGKVVRYD